jgi:hypothetical protein
MSGLETVVCVFHWSDFDTYFHATEDSANESDAESTSAGDALGVQLPPVEMCSEHATDVDHLRIHGSITAVAPSVIGIDPDSDTSELCSSGSSTSSTYSSYSPPPPYYVFAEDAPDIRASRVPVLPPYPRASFQAVPEWLDTDDPFQVENGVDPYVRRTVEAEGGYELLAKSGYVVFSPVLRTDLVSCRCWIHYLQLPPGVALPYVEEVVDP